MEILNCRTNPTCQCDKCGTSLYYNMSDVKAKILRPIHSRKKRVFKYVICPICNNEIWLNH